MSFTASPMQLRILREAVDDYCRDSGSVDHEERLYVAELVSSLFDFGAVSMNDLRRGIEDARGPYAAKRDGTLCAGLNRPFVVGPTPAAGLSAHQWWTFGFAWSR